MAEFIDEEIEVRLAGKPGLPEAFVWRGTEYEIVEVLEVRRILDLRTAWWRRRHRDYYVVRTDSGETFELYHHRGPGKRYWVLYRKLGA